MLNYHTKTVINTHVINLYDFITFDISVSEILSRECPE